MIGESVPTKTSRIVKAIRQAISCGEYAPGSRLPRLREIAGRFDASLAVVNHAFNQLEREGRIIRRPRSGVFVHSGTGNTHQELFERCILVAVPTGGHVFGELLCHLLTTIDEAGFLALSLNSQRLISPFHRDFHQKRLNQLLSSELFGVISVGSDYWRHPYLEDYPPERRVMLFELDYPALNCHAVLVDYESGYYQLTRHLVECGCRRIMFSASPAIIGGDVSNFHHFQQMRNGYERALRENNLMANCRYTEDFDNISDDEATIKLKKLLSSAGKPDAIMTYMDHQAAQLMRAASRIGCRIPDDLCITGFYNTPWACNQGRQLITSMAIDTGLMAQQATEILRNRPSTPRVIFLKPQLVPGESTLGPTCPISKQ